MQCSNGCTHLSRPFGQLFFVDIALRANDPLAYVAAVAALHNQVNRLVVLEDAKELRNVLMLAGSHHYYLSLRVVSELASLAQFGLAELLNSDYAARLAVRALPDSAIGALSQLCLAQTVALGQPRELEHIFHGRLTLAHRLLKSGA